MTFDDLKLAWQATDTQLQATQQLQMRLVHTLVRERSHSQLAKLQRTQQLTTILCIIAALGGYLLLGSTTLGLHHWYSLALCYLYPACFLLMAGLAFREWQRLSRLQLQTKDLREALRTALATYTRFIRFSGWVSAMGVTLVFVVIALRFLETSPPASGGETLAVLGLEACLAWLTVRTVRNKANQHLRIQLQEWQQELAELEAWSPPT